MNPGCFRSETDLKSIKSLPAPIFSEPVENFLDDRILFSDAFVKYYLNFEARYTWVVEYNHRKEGCLTGCWDTNIQRSQFKSNVLKPLVLQGIQGGYYLGRKTWRYGRLMLAAMFRPEFPTTNYEKYPVHLYINVDSEFRGQGWGRRLIVAYLDPLRIQEVQGVHLNTTNMNLPACKLYESLGCELLAIHPTHLWNRLVPGPVANLVAGLVLGD